MKNNTKGFVAVLLSAFKQGELENALYEAKLIYAKANNICSYEGWDLVDYVALWRCILRQIMRGMSIYTFLDD